MRMIIRWAGRPGSDLAEHPLGAEADEALRNTRRVDFLLLAHASHWAIWVLYSVPVLVVLAASLKAFRDQRREDRSEQP